MTRRSPRLLSALAAAAAVAVAGIIYVVWPAAPSPDGTANSRPGTSDSTFVGSGACASCHAAETASWQGSHHRHAMQDATEQTVLGNFRDARFTYNGVVSSFFRRDGGFWVRTDGADGTVADFRIRYTFGLFPLQQYLVEFPDGRVQALSIAWDARSTAEGGQRWFHLYPDDRIGHGDELHWTGRQQNWNFMCADCHSTNVRKGYDATTNRFTTTWSDVSVGCESCHGPGSSHIGWATAPAWRQRLFWSDNGLTVALDERRGITWATDPTTLKPLRSAPKPTAREVEVCGTCHSRRDQLAEGYVAGARLEDFYVVSPLSRGLYHADGQQLDEVYTFGSFAQSRMHAAGVTCSDCHDPHDGRPRDRGNALCERCHTPNRYGSTTHHLHDAASAPSCVACHMPARTYMGVDVRHDHSFRLPRPDRSVTLGVPNACTSCHVARTPGWASEALRARLGRNPGGFQGFAEAFSRADEAPGQSQEALAALAGDAVVPAIVRASSLERLAVAPDPLAVRAARGALLDADPLVRRLALRVFDRIHPSDRVAAVALLADPIRSVRIEAARVLAPASGLLVNPTDRERFGQALAECIASFRLHADRPEARMNLASLYRDLDRTMEAEAELRAAIVLAPRYTPAYVNLSDLLGQTGREAEGQAILRTGIRELPASADLHHALGLSLARAERYGDAVTELSRAAELSPDVARFTYAYAVALHSTGRSSLAIEVIERARRTHRTDRDLLVALTTFRRDAGRIAAARSAAEELVSLFPGDADARELASSLSPTTPR